MSKCRTRERAVPASVTAVALRDTVRGGPALDALLDPLIPARNVHGVEQVDVGPEDVNRAQHKHASSSITQ